MAKYSCIFGHYDPDGEIDQYILTYLEALTALSIRISFVSNSRLSQTAQDSLRLVQTDMVIAQRHNKGFDFGSWKYAIDHDMIPGDTDFLLLTNDSIFGPLCDIGPFFETMEARADIDFWGFTDSYQSSWHLQSYFVCLSRKAFTSKVFSDFFQQDFDSYAKKELVQKGEIGFSTVLMNNGFKPFAFSAYKLFEPDIEKYPGLCKNPTHFYWDRLIKETNFPFVKKELVLQNPENIQSMGTLFPFIRENSDYPVTNIKDFLINTYNKPAIHEPAIAVSVICHMYYPQSIYYFLLRLSVLKFYNTRFFFNLSTALRYDNDFIEILRASFPAAIILFSPSQGRDIGGKMIGIQTQLALDETSDYCLVIHDKLSPHFPLGIEWRNKLFEIIDKNKLAQIFDLFAKDPKTGAIGPQHSIKNEYNPDENTFRCTSSDQIAKLINAYDMNLTDYNFVAGTIFWIRTAILRRFFDATSPLAVRATFEKGNALDFVSGTNIHAWERIFTFLANAQGYKIKGV